MNADRLVARIPNNAAGRLAVRQLRAGLNRDRYRIRIYANGPRKHLQYATPLKEAREFRLYIDDIAGRSMMQQAYSHQTKMLQDCELKLWAATEKAKAEEAGRKQACHEWERAKDVADSMTHFLTLSRQEVRALQRQINDIPAWMLWAAGVWRDLRAQWDVVCTAVGRMRA